MKQSMKTVRDTHVSRLNVKHAPQVVELIDHTQLKEIERHLLRERVITPRECRYLSGDEIAKVLVDLI